MAADNYLRSYGDNSRREDVVLNAVEILTARENYIFNRLEKTTAIDAVHSYLVDSLKTAAANAQNEGDDYSYTARTTPSRLTNLVQHIHVPFAVSDTQRNIEHYHGRDELDRQTEKALMEFANDAELTKVELCLNHLLSMGKLLARKVKTTLNKQAKAVQLQRLSEMTLNWEATVRTI